jgi:hypothetical protein
MNVPDMTDSGWWVLFVVELLGGVWVGVAVKRVLK